MEKLELIAFNRDAARERALAKAQKPPIEDGETSDSGKKSSPPDLDQQQVFTPKRVRPDSRIATAK